jgi:hypothetical protein
MPAELFEKMFYEVMWRAKAKNDRENKISYPIPWWVQQYFRHWSDSYDGGLFPSKETAFCSNANYRYWNMVGVKDHTQESLVGQAGEVEPVYDKYSVKFFLFTPDTKELYFPQYFSAYGKDSNLDQGLVENYLPVIDTFFTTPIGVKITQRVFATTESTNQRSVIILRYHVGFTGNSPKNVWLCVSASPDGPTGFQRRDNAGRYISDNRISSMRYRKTEGLLEVNSWWGPIFKDMPKYYGLYGNEMNLHDPEHYLTCNPYNDLGTKGQINGLDVTSDFVSGLCTGVFAWPINFDASNRSFSTDIILPVDDFRGFDDLSDLRSQDINLMEENNLRYWREKLNNDGIYMDMPSNVSHLFDLYRTCRANVLILADNGQIHPGPTIYDSFWVRDSSVEGIACALAGDINLAMKQFGYHYTKIFSLNENDWIDGVNLKGFFGGEHEKNDKEWDSNGQALWAIGKLDRILGKQSNFGQGLYLPYVIEAVRWLNRNRSVYGLLHHGWSAEHIGGKDEPHYWDDFWGIAGLWEAAKLAERIGAPEKNEIWSVYESLKTATADSIRYVLNVQRQKGFWETFIPTGPKYPGALNSTMVGTLAYFHPCRLYMNEKLGEDIDYAARMTLETIWSHFVRGGFDHYSAWRCYGPYLTIQLAHCFLLTGNIERMDKLLDWSYKAGFAKVNTWEYSPYEWKVVLGAWNEQHCYPIAENFSGNINWPDWWYMGDIPHGWACAEFMLLLRDIMFFEADEDNDPHIYIAPGIMPHWLKDGQYVSLHNAPTLFGNKFGYRITHYQWQKRLEIEITQPAGGNVRYVYPCRFGSVGRIIIDGNELAPQGNDVFIKAGTRNVTVYYK